jgi:hypothetical protein
MRQRILRRLSDGLRRQDWAGVAIDFAIVVLGVFVGIQASNLNSARIDKALQAEYLERIDADLDAIIARAQDQRQFEKTKSRQVLAALAMTRPQGSEEKSVRLGHLLTAMTTRLSPNFESSTFNEIQNSGRLSLIEDPRLRMHLSAYFARLQYLRSAIGRNNDSYVESFADFPPPRRCGRRFRRTRRRCRPANVGQGEGHFGPIPRPLRRARHQGT